MTLLHMALRRALPLPRKCAAPLVLRKSPLLSWMTRRTMSDYSDISVMPLFASDAVQDKIKNGLKQDGFCIIKDFAGADVALQMREEAQRLYEDGHMFPSKSTDEYGNEMVKHNVYATELDGNEWEIAPTLLDYTRSVVLQAPILLDYFFPHLKMSKQAYGTKLAVSLGEGSKYPKHCDNSGLPDQRKVTMVYYLNPHWEPSDGGELRIFTDQGPQTIEPLADTLAMFWSDQIVHDVLPTLTDTSATDKRRYALTLWLVADNKMEIANPRDPLTPLRLTHFPTE